MSQAAFDKHLAEIDPFDAQVMQGYWDAWKGKIPGVSGRDRIVALDHVAEWRKLIRTKDESPSQALNIIFHASKELTEPKDVTDTERPALGPRSGFGEAAG